MSQLASATRLSAADIPALVEAALPQRSFFGHGPDRYAKLLSERGSNLSGFEYSGMYVVTVLVYLQERGIDLLEAHDSAATQLTERRGTTHIIFTPQQRGLLAQFANVDLNPSSLQTYYQEFNEVNDPAAGEAMVAAVSYVRNLIHDLRDGEVAVLSIG